MGRVTQEHIVDDFDITEDMEREFPSTRKDTNMHYGNETAAYAKLGAMDPNALKQALPEGYSPIDQLRSAYGSAVAAAEAVTMIRTSLCGPPPPSSVKSVNVNNATSQTVFAEMRQLAGMFEELATRIQLDMQDVNSAFLGSDLSASGRIGA